MKPERKQEFDCPGADPILLREHCARLNPRYFELFPRESVCVHVECLSRLTGEHPYELITEIGEQRRVDCTLLGFDYPFVLSLITGILSSSGTNIVEGDAFTYGKVQAEPVKAAWSHRRSGTSGPGAVFGRRMIIDRFSCLLDVKTPFEEWRREIRQRLDGVIGLLERGDERSVTSAKQQVNEMVAANLADQAARDGLVLYPLHIEVNNEGEHTRMRVVSQDSPFFLYTLTTALSLQDISIERVRIRTVRGEVQDELHFVGPHGKPVVQADALNQIKLVALLTKQFAYFLGNSPDPYAALIRFEQLVGEVVRMAQPSQWIDMLSDPHVMQDLARLLGASDFLWEDFIRLQYENLLPMLQPHGQHFSPPLDELPKKLERILEEASDFEARIEKLNEFKDRHIFLMDLENILTPGSGFTELSKNLTQLAELVVDRAAEICLAALQEKHGTPRTVAGLRAKLTVLGLGKLGGAALGYASDIELLFVYSDSGWTDGTARISNAEFFDLLVRQVALAIRTKQEGIFRVDLRLRPFGSAGPLACSVERFCWYYGEQGRSHSYERLSLVRMRTIAGERDFGAQIERLRDEMLYSSAAVIDLRDLQELRERQVKEHSRDGMLNAKFSAGALVDLEYAVQILQVTYGRERGNLRTPLLHQALEGLRGAGVLERSEEAGLIEAYHFLRKLINSLRMLRGSASDLFLPAVGTPEYAHLARRMGYERGKGIEPSQQLYVDFETLTAVVRAFLERHFGTGLVPGTAHGNVADLILSEAPSADFAAGILRRLGFADCQRSYVNLASLARGFSHMGAASRPTGSRPDRGRQELFARLAVLACDVASRKPDPDMALNNWERFAHALKDPAHHFNVLLAQPMRLDILLSIFSVSQFLSDTLIRNPLFFDWVTMPENINQIRPKIDIESDLRTLSKEYPERRDWLNQIRLYRRREILRIGTRDVGFSKPIEEIMLELSRLAESMVGAALRRTAEAAFEDLSQRFCIMALGKLGGMELNYSSDIDLLGVYDGCSDEQDFVEAMQRVWKALSAHTEEGYTYRVDLRLRPYGASGELVHSVPGLLKYYRSKAALWEIQALLKMRPVAGNLELGHRFLNAARSLLTRSRPKQEVISSIESMRQEQMKNGQGRSAAGIDIKSGAGGLRDIEFTVQGLQLLHAAKADLAEANTIRAMTLLESCGLLTNAASRQLKGDYLFLRRIEHLLQLFEDRQTQTVPRDPRKCTALARRVLGNDASADDLLRLLTETRDRVCTTCQTALHGRSGTYSPTSN